MNNQQNQEKEQESIESVESVKSVNEPYKQPQKHPQNQRHSKRNLAWLAWLVAMLLIGMVLGVVATQQFGGMADDKATTTTTDKSLNKSLNKQQNNGNGQPSAGSNSSTDKSDKTAQAELPVLTVEVVTPQQAQVATNISADGTLTAKNTASVSSRVNGLAIESVIGQEGQWVNKGDVLATFDTKTLQQNAIQAEAGVRQAKANVKQNEASVVQASVNLTKAQVDLERVLPLLEIGAVSQQQVDSYQAQLEQAKASLTAAKQSVESAKEAVVSAQAQLNNQQINLIDSQLRSPISGIISQKNAQVGAVPQGSLFTIIEDGRLEWKAELSPTQARKLKVGMPVVVKVSDTQTIQGRVSRLDPVAGSNRQISVYVSLQSSQGVQSGMLLTGEFITGVEQQLILPVSAITSNDGYDYLMAVEDMKQTAKPIADTATGNVASNVSGNVASNVSGNEQDKQSETIVTGRVKRVKVELGRQDNNAVVIQSAIPQNLAVVRQGSSFLSEGDLVRVVRVVRAAQDAKINKVDKADEVGKADEGEQ